MRIFTEKLAFLLGLMLISASLYSMGAHGAPDGSGAGPVKTKPAKPKSAPAETKSALAQGAAGPHPLPATIAQGTRIVALELHDEVSLGMAAFVRRVAASLHDGDLLLVDINTFGGRLDSGVAIRDALLGCRDKGAHTVTFIHPRAISAGALIAFATEVIVVAPGATMGASTPVQMEADGETKPAGEKAVSYMRKEMRATAEIFKRNGDIAEAMVDPDVEVPSLSPKGKLLTLDTETALRWGVASFKAADRAELLRGLGYGPGHPIPPIVEENWNWAEEISGWLSSAVVSSLLMSIGMLGLMIGLYTGGSPLPLSVGGICLALFFFGQYITHLAGIEDVLLLLLGLTLVGFEAFLPGHIVPGVLGILCIIGALLMGLLDFRHVPWSVQWEMGTILSATATLFGSFLVTALLGVLAVRLLPRTNLGQALVLDTAVTGRATDTAERAPEAQPGALGMALSDLRPAGKIQIGEHRYEAQAEQGFIEAGALVRVVRRQGFHLVVTSARALKETP